MRSTFKVLFYLKRTKNTPRAVYPVMGRITINGTISQFSAKINVPEQLWEVKGGRAKGKSVESERINRHLDNIRIQIGKHYQSICDHDAYVTAEKVKNAYLGMGERYRTLVDVFEHYTNDLFKRIGVDRSKSTWWRYRASLGHLRAFLKHEYNLHDIPLLELEQSFIEQYHVYLKTVCRSKAGSVCRYMDRWNNVVKISFENGLMPRNSFALCRYSAPREPRTFLSEKELRIFQTTRLKSAKHEPPRPVSLFLFYGNLLQRHALSDLRTNHTGHEGSPVDTRQPLQDGRRIYGQISPCGFASSGKISRNSPVTACL